VGCTENLFEALASKLLTLGLGDYWLGNIFSVLSKSYLPDRDSVRTPGLDQGQMFDGFSKFRLSSRLCRGRISENHAIVHLAAKAMAIELLSVRLKVLLQSHAWAIVLPCRKARFHQLPCAFVRYHLKHL
jgi:hypothetical protein